MIGCSDAAAAASRLSSLGPTVVVKCGPKGVIVGRHGDSFALPSPSVEPLDTTGAGDNFDAGLLAGVLAGLDIRTAATIGAACGSVATQGYGGIGRTATASEAWRIASRLLATDGAAPRDDATGPKSGEDDI